MNPFPSIDVVVPVFNEERRLIPNIKTLHRFLRGNYPADSWQILIAENGSTDQTPQMADRLTDRYRNIRVLHMDRPGRGNALACAWRQSRAEILAYMDVDLATDLQAFPDLIARIVQGDDLAIGSRLTPGARVERSRKREMISRVYNLLVRWMFRVPTTDAQCGFKAMSRSTAESLLPEIESRHWFFDTELLVKAHRRNLRIQEVPVRWVENPDSRVKLLRTILHMAFEMTRLRLRLWADQRTSAQHPLCFGTSRPPLGGGGSQARSEGRAGMVPASLKISCLEKRESTAGCAE